MKVLVVMNFGPDESAPHRGRWVVDQVEATRSLGVEVDLYSFKPGKSQYLPAIREIRSLLRLSRLLSRRTTLNAPVSSELLREHQGRPGIDSSPGRTAILPCGPDLSRFTPSPRDRARHAIGLEPDGRYIFFPASPARPEKRFELALRLAETVGARVLTGGHIPPEEMPNWMNAADAVVITSAYEGFGLACLESLACETPVLSTPVGIAPLALRGLDNTLCEPFDLDRWSHFLGDLLDAPEARARGRERVGAFSAERLAERVVLAYREVLDGAPEGFDIRPPVEA